MSDGVIYLSVGTKHADNLVVSLLSLRDHWSGPICIFVGDESAAKNAELIFADGRLGHVQAIRFNIDWLDVDYNVMFAKAYMINRLSPFDRTVYLDADTVVVGDFSELFPVANEVRLTKYAPSVQAHMQERLREWRGIAPISAKRAQEASFCLINAGVVGFSKKTRRFLRAWEQMTRRRLSRLCDEEACQLVYPEFPHVLLDDRFNCSPKHAWCHHGVGLPDADPKIWHNYGDISVSEPTARYIWWPYYQRALADNLANIREWGPDKYNERLVSYLKDPTCFGPDFIPDPVTVAV